MGDINIVATEWRTVQVGRVVLIQEGPAAGRLAAIVEIIDHKRVRSRPPAVDNITARTRRGG